MQRESGTTVLAEGCLLRPIVVLGRCITILALDLLTYEQNKYYVIYWLIIHLS